MIQSVIINEEPSTKETIMLFTIDDPLGKLLPIESIG